MAASPARVSSPAVQPKTRAMLVAPALPLPMLRMSPPKSLLETIIERLNEPST